MIFDFLTQNLQESFLIPLIGLLLSTFLYKITAYFVEDQENRTSKEILYFWDPKGKTPQEKEAYDRRKRLQKEERRKVFTYSMFLGVVALVLGIWGFLQTNRDPRLGAPSRGVALGGFLLVLYNTVMRWNEFEELIRIAVLGLSFFALALAAFWFA